MCTLNARNDNATLEWPVAGSNLVETLGALKDASMISSFPVIDAIRRQASAKRSDISPQRVLGLP